MKLGRRQIAELVAVVGVVVGVIALFTPLTIYDIPSENYAHQGFLVAELVLLGLAGFCLAASLASLRLGKAELDLIAAAAGAAAFGLYLFRPALWSDHIDELGSGVWLGVCVGLIPLGAGAARLWRRRSDEEAPGFNLWTVGAAVGVGLIVVGIWYPVFDYSSKPTFWTFSNFPRSGHTVGLLLLILAIVSAVLIVLAANSKKLALADIALIVAAITAGVATTEGVVHAFGSVGQLGEGAWLLLSGGLVLLLALIGSRVVKLPELKK